MYTVSDTYTFVTDFIAEKKLISVEPKIQFVSGNLDYYYLITNRSMFITIDEEFFVMLWEGNTMIGAYLLKNMHNIGEMYKWVLGLESYPLELT